MERSWRVMANVLILYDALPFPVNHGGRLRVYHLSAALSGANKCYLAAFAINQEQLDAVSSQGIYEDILLLPLAPEKPSVIRHLRLSNAHLIEASHPTYYRHIVVMLNNYIRQHAIDISIAGDLHLAEYLRGLTVRKRVVDDFDCHSLTMEREYGVSGNEWSMVHKFLYKVALHRTRGQEGGLTKWCDLVTTISEPDKKRLAALSKTCRNVFAVVPNGVAPELEAEDCGQYGEIENAVVFWGNLTFRPNYSAVQYFYNSIYLPYLASEGITWYIVGRDADDWIRGIAEKHDNIVATGFVDDLFDFVKRVPIAINPMIMGSGLKNKVLEAFALKRTVISTSMGVEAIEAVPGKHYVLADAPKTFAEQVIRYLDDPDGRRSIGEDARHLIIEKYTWEVVGQRWQSAIEGILRH